VRRRRSDVDLSAVVAPIVLRPAIPGSRNCVQDGGGAGPAS
jgi:hypothetical protein